MSDAGAKLEGSERAAVLLMSLGEEEAAEVFRHMDRKEVQRLATAMTAMTKVSQAQVEGVYADFMEAVDTHTALGMDTEAYIRRVLVQALGEEKATSLIDRILLGGSAHGIETLKWMEPRSVADIIRNEHPQIIAIVLCYLDRDVSATVLEMLNPRTRIDVLMRISTLDALQPAALRELNEMLEAHTAGAQTGQSSVVGGVKTTAEILNFVDSSMEGEIMEEIKESDGDLGQRIQDLMFVFENLLDVDDSGIQVMLREASSESLMLALKGADEPMREKIFRNMSKRAAEMMRDDLEAKGPVRLSEVETAQKEILTIARRLADEGQIQLGGGGEEFV